MNSISIDKTNKETADIESVEDKPTKQHFAMIKANKPLKWPSVEELQSQLQAYFDDTPRKEWTITGLALALNTTRSTLNDYQNGILESISPEDKALYTATIRKAKEMIHNQYEIDLRKQGRSGDIFALKNFGWTDERSVTTTSINKLELDDEQVKAIAKRALYNDSNVVKDIE